MLTLKEAITHAEQSAVLYATTDPPLASDMKQLAEWLSELRDRRLRDEITLRLLPVPPQQAAATINARLEQERAQKYREELERSVTDQIASLVRRSSSKPANDWCCVFLLKKPGVDVNVVAEQMRSMPGVRYTFVHSQMMIDEGVYPGVEARFHRDAAEPLCRMVVVGCEGRLHYWVGM